MNVILIWPDYFEDKSEDLFWLECEYCEAIDILIPEIKRRFPDDHQQAAEDIESFFHQLKDSYDHSYDKNYPWQPGCVYFLISRNLLLIKPMPHYFPYSGQWNGYCPFRTIKPQVVKNLDELGSVDATIVDVCE